MPRPRSETVRRAVLDAALQGLREKEERRLTMEGIARRAGVSKQTVYRWWPSPAAVLMEALSEQSAAIVSDEDHGALEPDLRAFIRDTVAGLRREWAPIVASLMAQSQQDPVVGEAFRERFLSRRRAALRAVLARGRERGEVDPGSDLDLLVDIAFGTVWYRVLGQHAPLSRRFADDLTDALLALTRAARRAGPPARGRSGGRRAGARGTRPRGA